MKGVEARCLRCGITRHVKEGRCPHGLCRDCTPDAIWRRIAEQEAARWRDQMARIVDRDAVHA